MRTPSSVHSTVLIKFNLPLPNPSSSWCPRHLASTLFYATVTVRMNSKYEAVIGLECHCQLLTHSKLFCSCSTSFGESPNMNTCPVCLGLPGALPVLNRVAVTMAIKAGLGLHCTINIESQWSRKNYFYPDLPKGY